MAAPRHWAPRGTRITDDLTLDALDIALAPAPPPGLLHHSDRGSQAASTEYQRVLVQHAIVCNMSRRDGCWDNAVARELLRHLEGRTHHDARLEHAHRGMHRDLRGPRAFYTGGTGIRRLAFSGSGRPSSSGQTKQRELHSGVHEIGARPVVNFPGERRPRRAKLRGMVRACWG